MQNTHLNENCIFKLACSSSTQATDEGNLPLSNKCKWKIWCIAILHDRNWQILWIEQ